MDLRLYFGVIWRFRYLVAVGILLAGALTFLSVFKVTRSGEVSYRQSETWRSSERLFLTQVGCPWCRTVYPLYSIDPATGQPTTNTPFADSGRFSSLTVFYAQLANSDAVRREVAASGPLGGTYVQRPSPTTPPTRSSCFRSSTSAATRRRRGRRRSSPGGCLERSRRTWSGARRRRRCRPSSACSSRSARSPGRRPSRREDGSPSPIVVFLTVLIATVGLAFILENLRPRIRPLPGVLEHETSESATARTGTQGRRQ